MSYRETGQIDLRRIMAMMADPLKIVHSLDESQISKLQTEAQKNYDADEQSCQEWRARAKKLMDMARMTDNSRSGFLQPWMSDIQLPDLIHSAIQFNSRTMPEYIKDGKVCQPEVVGSQTDEKLKRARRVCDHINWQLQEEIIEWPENMDKLLLQLPIVGCMFRATVWDAAEGRITDTLLLPDRVTLDNSPNNPDWARRISIDMRITHNQYMSRVQCGEWRDENIQQAETEVGDERLYDIVQMHTVADLDGDDYEEPYILTFSKREWKLLAVTPRFDMQSIVMSVSANDPNDHYAVGINPVNYITRYQFFPDPNGSALGMGYGHIMYGMVKTRNTGINQLMDAGTRQNLGGGFIKKGVFRDDGLRIIRPGMFEVVDGDFGAGTMQDAVWPFPSPTPSVSTLNVFSELGSSISRIAATGDIMSGEGAPANMPATSVMAIIEQGKTGQRAILKRINLSLKHELQLIHRLNQSYLTDKKYMAVGDFEEKQVAKADYSNADYDIVPVADPMFSSRIERLTRIQAAMQIGIQSPKLQEKYLIELGFSEKEAQEYVAGDMQMKQAALAGQQQAEMLKQQEQTAKAQKEAAEAQARLLEMQGRIMVDHSRALLQMEQAKKLSTDNAIAKTNAELEQMSGVTAAHPTQEEIADEQPTITQQGQPGGVQPVVDGPDNASVLQQPAGGLQPTESGNQPEQPVGFDSSAASGTADAGSGVESVSNQGGDLPAA